MRQQIVKVVAYYKIATDSDEELSLILESLETAAAEGGADLQENYVGENEEKIQLISTSIDREGFPDPYIPPVVCPECGGVGVKPYWVEDAMECEKCGGDGYVWETK